MKTREEQIQAVLDEPLWEPGSCSARKAGVCVNWEIGPESPEPPEDLWDYVGVHRLDRWINHGGDPKVLQRVSEGLREARGRHGLGFLERPGGQGRYKKPLSPASRKKILEAYQRQTEEEQAP